MAKGLVKLCYLKIIDENSQGLWEKSVFDDTYMEFFMQAQFYNQDGKYQTFQELVRHIPAAEKLHYLVSTAAINYIRQLNGQIPDITNGLGKLCLPFQNFRFEILQSHIHHKKHHKVAVYFYSEPLIWLDTIHEQLLITHLHQKEALFNGNEVITEMVHLEANLTISSFQNL